jgi:F-type H+-transporting ATPase subunit b
MTVDWWTLGFQAVNVAILVGLLGHFFWRPVAGIIDQRGKVSQQALEDADAKQKQAAKALQDIEATRAGFAAEREAILADAQEAARTLRAGVLEKAAAEADAIRKAGESQLAAERRQAEHAWQDKAGELAVEIAGKLLARIDAAVVQSGFVKALEKALEDLPEGTRRSFGSAESHLKVISARPLAPAEKKRLDALVQKVFGASPALQFELDDSLIAGVELRGKHLNVRNSWRADLDTILGEIRDAPGQ